MAAQTAHPTIPAMRSGMRMSNVLSRPRSSTEKAGRPKADVHRSQLGTPPRSSHPVGVRNRNEPMSAITPEMIEAATRAGRSNFQDSTVSSDVSGTVSPLTCWRICSETKLLPNNSYR